MEGDHIIWAFHTLLLTFQSTPSAWRETVAESIYFDRRKTFQSTPSAWRETCAICTGRGYRRISIHSLRMEGDITRTLTTSAIMYFNPLPPHGGRPMSIASLPSCMHFNPLPPHGGRRIVTLTRLVQPEISIHSLHMEGDCGEKIY